MKLWEIISKIDEELERTCGEISEEVENLYQELAQKTDNCVGVLQALESAEAHHRGLATQQTLAARRMASARERLRWYMLTQAKAKGGGLQGEAWAVRVVKCKPSMIVSDLLVPAEFKDTSTVVTVAKDRISEALKAGVFVPGVELRGGETLKISPCSKLN